MIFYVVCIFSYIIPILAYRIATVPLISPVSTAVIFYFTQFGPQALVHGFLRYATDPSPLHDQRFLLALTIANVTLGLGILLARPFFRLQESEPVGARHEMLVRSTRGALVIVVAAIIYGLLFIAADGPGVPRLREHLLYLLQQSTYSYTEVRRVLFAESFVTQFQEYTRQSTTVLLIGVIALTFLRTRGIWRIALLGAGLFVFITAALQLNKFPLLYFLVCIAIITYVFKTKSFSIGFKGGLIVAIGIPALLALLFGMYLFQYADAVRRGVLSTENFMTMIFYRPFMAESDALRLWFEEFPDRTPFLGVRNIKLLASIFGLEFLDVTRHIPRVYLRHTLTTFQTGFIGSGYASFGYIGIAAYGLIVGAISVVATALVVRIREFDVKAIFCAVLCLNMYFLFSREFSTALLSGGIAPVLAIGLLYVYLRGRAATPATGRPLAYRRPVAP